MGKALKEALSSESMAGVEVIGLSLAAGASSRMKSSKSKLATDVLGKSVVGWSLKAMSYLAKEVIVVVGHQKEEVQAAALRDASHLKLSWAHQESPKGTADAVKAGLSKMSHVPDSSHVFIMGAADGFLLYEETLRNFLHLHVESKAMLTVATMHLAHPAEYGRILRNTTGALERIVEFKDANESQKQISEVNTGFYLLQMGSLRQAIAEIGSENEKNEFYLTDLVEIYRKKNWLTQAYVLPRAEEALGINTQKELSEARALLRSRINNSWMKEGVRMDDPLTTWIDDGVVLSQDVHLEAGVSLRGKTKISSNVRVGAYSIVEDSMIDSDSVIEPFCHIKGARLSNACKVGPFSRLRPETELESHVHVGNFVEIKKSRLKKHVKAGHLSYLGDADIGEGSNIGAGTITCNYDGFSKHKTLLGAGVFVGSNSSLVAPVEIGAGVIVGAGSVITKDVEPDAIAVERSDQREIAGGAKKFREKRKKT